MCHKTFPYAISQSIPPQLLPTHIHTQQVTCPGGSDGSIHIQHPQAVMARIDNGPWAPVADFDQLAAGSYTVQIQDASGCSSNVMQVSIDTRSDIFASGQVSTQHLTLGTAVQLTSLSTGYTHLLWTLGDGQTSSLPQATHIYTQEGVYAPSLHITDTLGCADTWQAPPIRVTALPPIVIPNAFSPNADGINDYWTVSAPHLTSTTIYSRIGTVVWQAQGNSLSWNGNDTRGQAAPEGVYTAVLRFSNSMKTTSIVLIR
jgi:gliding motility-associated-like protein